MRIATFNVNSVRARMPRLSEWLEEAQPDIVALQETKVDDDKFPILELEEIGYRSYIHGQPRLNGVCFLSKTELTDVTTGFCDPDMPEDCRIIVARAGDLTLINTYVPNGTSVISPNFPYKLQWLERFREFCNSLGSTDDPLIWLGDINIAPTPDDVYDSHRKLGGIGHHPEEFVRLKRIVEWGWTDCFRLFTSGPGHYTYFDFRFPNVLQRNLGWRIDHIYASQAVLPQVQRCWIDKEVRTREKPSDHAPVLIDLN